MLAAPVLLALLAPALPAADAIGRAAQGLSPAVVEEDGQPDRRLLSLPTTDFVMQMVADGRSYRIDWRAVDQVALEDTFVYVAAGTLRIAIVGDASRPDQARRLHDLSAAMQDRARACTQPR